MSSAVSASVLFIREKLAPWVQVADSIDTCSKDIDNQCNRTKDMIRKSFVSIREALMQRESELLDSVDVSSI